VATAENSFICPGGNIDDRVTSASVRRFAADWWMENERVVEQRAERQRMTDYYARTKKEQEDRENAEARERFIAQQQTISRASKP
jgi:hypothetical protein